jgi:hypothetical protein
VLDHERIRARNQCHDFARVFLADGAAEEVVVVKDPDF